MKKYLTFKLAEESYGVPIDVVREIIGATSVEMCEVPDCPHYALGVINLRDKVIPVVCLRTKFDMDTVDIDDTTCIIILETGEDKLTGIVVDSVSDVIQAEDDDIDPSPDFGNGLDTKSITGLYKTDSKVCILLNEDVLKV